MEVALAAAADAATTDKEEQHSHLDFLSPKAFLEAVRCLETALHKRLDKEVDEITLLRPRSGLRSAMGTRIPAVLRDTGQVCI